MTNINRTEQVEKRLRKALVKHGRSRESLLYHSTCGPAYWITREEFRAIAVRLSEEGTLEVLSGTRLDSFWYVRKDLVDDAMRNGITV